MISENVPDRGRHDTCPIGMFGAVNPEFGSTCMLLLCRIGAARFLFPVFAFGRDVVVIVVVVVVALVEHLHTTASTLRDCG